MIMRHVLNIYFLTSIFSIVYFIQVKQIQRFLSVAENVVTDNNSYPVSAKVYLAESGPKDGHNITPFSRYYFDQFTRFAFLCIMSFLF